MLFACKKVEDKIRTDTSNTASLNKKDKSSSDRVGSPIDSLEYYFNLISPTGAVKDFIKQGGVLPITKYVKDYRDLLYQKNIGNGSFPYVCSNGIVVLGYPGAVCPGGGTGSKLNQNNSSGLDCLTYILDPYGNKIYAFYMYDDKDSRQFYYVYLPDNFNANSPIVVLIHGGGWFSGPNPDNTNGWQLSYSDNPSQTNIVKDLLTAQYVVVMPLYRLSKYGNNNTEIVSNTTTLQNQIDDIDSTIVNVRRNFPSCLGINANSIQVLGESAGGHLALMWAYTKSTTPISYIKSVISCYAPTNLQQYGNYLKSKASGIYSCGNVFNHFPFYYPVVINDINNTYSSISPLTCAINPVQAALYPGVIFRIVDSYNMIQSAVATVITTPLSSTLLSNYSPKNVLVSSRIIPTYIMHGDAGSDKLVPYNQATDGMSTKLSSTGGIIATLTNNNLITYTYSSEPNKHLIQLFPGANHTWGGTTSVTKDNIRANIVQWLNGHK